MKKVIYLILFAVFLAVPSFAQENPVATVEKTVEVVEKTAETVEKVANAVPKKEKKKTDSTQDTSKSAARAAVETVYDDSKSVVSTVYEDGKSVISTIYGDGKEATKALYPDIKSAIVKIAHGLGVAAEHLYTVLVKQYVVIGVKWLLLFLVGLGLVIAGLVGVTKFNRKNIPINYSIILPCVFTVVGAILLICVNYNDMLMGLINPEYGAINYIIDTAKSFVN